MTQRHGAAMAREIERCAGVEEVLDEWLALNPQPRSVAGLQVVNVSAPGWILPTTECRHWHGAFSVEDDHGAVDAVSRLPYFPECRALCLSGHAFAIVQVTVVSQTCIGDHRVGTARAITLPAVRCPLA
jgi:hypothetical protein